MAVWEVTVVDANILYIAFSPAILQLFNPIAFLQRQQDGDAVQCCARDKKEATASGGLPCEGAAYVCSHFYDSAPSGSFGNS